MANCLCGVDAGWRKKLLEGYLRLVQNHFKIKGLPYSSEKTVWF